ncbi:MAG: DUF7010 family protein [Gemmatimonadaceae bacterium]
MTIPLTQSTTNPQAIATDHGHDRDLQHPALAAMVDEERERMARLTARGIGMPIAGIFYWLVVAWLVRAYPLNTAGTLSFIATGAVFPLGVLVNRWFGGNLFAKASRFDSLGMLFNAMQFAAWPVIALVYFTATPWTWFTMGVLFGAHFLGYAWLYRSRGYGVLGGGMVGVLALLALVTRSPLPTTVPLIAAAVYAVAVAMVWGELRRSR